MSAALMPYVVRRDIPSLGVFIMHGLRKSLRVGAVAAILAVGAIAATATIASADTACNSSGECWQTKQRYDVKIYPPELGVQFYDNDWRKSHETDAKYKWMKDRDDDHGYYSHGEWHDIK
jgi:hypothetical protein